MRARASASTCPPELPAERLQIPTSDDPIAVVHYDGDAYEMQAPELRLPGGFERTVFYLICPAPEAGWFDAEGARVPPAEPAPEIEPAEPVAPG